MTESDYWLDTDSGDKLFVKRFVPKAHLHATPVLMIHGSIENGKIFYSKSGKGLAPYLCSLGYDVFVPDLRGRGKSSPSISKKSTFGNFEIIKQDLPAYTAFIKYHSGNKKPFWVGHSWGGVLLMSMYARELCSKAPLGVITFGTKRRISVSGLKKWYMIDFFWVFVSKILKYTYGYLPAAKIGMGSDNETINTHNETHALVVSKEWKEPRDGFDYIKALESLHEIPSLFITGESDDVLGHYKDVRSFMEESNLTNGKLILAGKTNGFSEDFDHINILTHTIAPKEIFPVVSDWMNKAIVSR